MASIDQVRGYAIFGMILVNFLGFFHAMPWTFKHHNAGFSYADTIAPLFIFVVGMGFRLSFQRRTTQMGLAAARWSALKRYCIIGGIGIVLGGFDLRVSIWDALLDIACAGLLTLPVIHRGAAARVALACVYLVLYQVAFSLLGYGPWVMGNSINGGPLGILSWAFILLFGTLAMDLVQTGDSRKLIRGCVVWGVALSAAGLLLHVPWGTFKPEWTFSQRGMSSPYPLLSAGLSFLTFLAFHLLCERGNLRIPQLTVLGENPLVMYILQAFLIASFHEFLARDGAALYAVGWFVVLYGCCYAVAHYMHRNRIIVKI